MKNETISKAIIELMLSSRELRLDLCRQLRSTSVLNLGIVTDEAMTPENQLIAVLSLITYASNPERIVIKDFLHKIEPLVARCGYEGSDRVEILKKVSQATLWMCVTLEDIADLADFTKLVVGDRKLATKLVEDCSYLISDATYKELSDSDQQILTSRIIPIAPPSLKKRITQMMRSGGGIEPDQWFILAKETEMSAWVIANKMESMSLAQRIELVSSPRLTAKKKSAIVKTFSGHSRLRDAYNPYDRFLISWAAATTTRSVNLILDCLMGMAWLAAYSREDEAKQILEFLNDKKNFLHLVEALRRFIPAKQIECSAQVIQKYIQISDSIPARYKLGDFELRISFNELCEYLAVISDFLKTAGDEGALKIMEPDLVKKCKLLI